MPLVVDRIQGPAPAGERVYQPKGASLELMYAKESECLIEGPSGTGKAQPVSSVIWTPFGPRLMGSIKVGDIVCSPDGGWSIVTAIFPQGEQDIYEITFTCGDKVECTSDHLWEIHYFGGDKKAGKKIRELRKVVPTKDINLRGRWLPSQGVVSFIEQPVPISPYSLGVLLGDGYLRKHDISFTSADAEIATKVQEELGKDYQVKFSPPYTYSIIGTTRGSKRPCRASKGYVNWHRASKKWMARVRTPGGGARYLGVFEHKHSAVATLEAQTAPTQNHEELTRTSLWNDLDILGLSGKRSGAKFIPPIYKYNSPQVRLAILQGLMDTDGTVDRKLGQPSFCSISSTLARDVKFLIESLGGLCTITTKYPKGGQKAYNCYIRYSNPQELFQLTRKKVLAHRTASIKRMFRTIELVGRKECQCIQISREDGLYLTEAFIPTHNSRSALEKLHICANKYPGMRGAIVRKTRESLTQSTLVTYETKVLPSPGAVKFHYDDQEYRYPNGSCLALAGMDKESRIMSSDYDIIYVAEATELLESEVEILTTRLRNGVMPYQQLIMDCNPSSADHWLNQRCIRGTTRRLISRHEDNPSITPEYLEKLDNLTGYRYKRLRLGLWVSAEGQFFHEWDEDKHIIEPFEVTGKGWSKWASIDYGYSDPFCCLWFARNFQDHHHIYIYRESYGPGLRDEQQAQKVYEASKGDKIGVYVADPSMFNARREQNKPSIASIYVKNGVRPLVPGINDRLVGWQTVRRALAWDEEHKPRLQIMKGRAPNLARTIPTMVHDPLDSEDMADKIRSTKTEDHAVDALRYGLILETMPTQQRLKMRTFVVREG